MIQEAPTIEQTQREEALLNDQERNQSIAQVASQIAELSSAIAEMSSMIAQLAQAQQQSSQIVGAHIAEMSDQIGMATEMIVRALTAPKMLTTDEKGRPNGVRTQQRLDA
jgi:uncharacterized protein YoxC